MKIKKTFYLDRDEYEYFEQTAKERNITTSELLRRLIFKDNIAEKLDKKNRSDLDIFINEKLKFSVEKSK